MSIIDKKNIITTLPIDTQLPSVAFAAPHPTAWSLTHPTAWTARTIENLVITQSDSSNLLIKGGCFLLSRLISVTIFPILISLEIVFKQAPKFIYTAVANSKNYNQEADKLTKCVLSLIFFPLGLYAPESVSGFFLQLLPSNMIRPFGVEELYGRKVSEIYYPKTTQEIQELVRKAKREKKQISIIGAGMSEGPQMVPSQTDGIVINTKHLNQIAIAEDGKTATVGSGATWEELQLALNRRGKSVIVKQASDPFSIGGSIGINCHGWAHESGAIASTVRSLQIIDSEGNLKTLTPKDELFKCQFGTLGYFGIIVNATLEVTDNEDLEETAKEIDIDDFASNYETEIKGKDFPLFGGRLVLDSLEGDPLRKVCMVRYSKIGQPKGSTRPFIPEPQEGTRIERIGLKLFAHLSNFSVTRLISWFWARERAQMLKGRRLTRNEALHPPINAFKMLHASNLHTQWLQEYFIKKENLPNFLRFLGAELKANQVRLINATIRPVPKDPISILPYAEQDRYAVVICWSQIKTEREISRTRKWIETVNSYLISQGDRYYQAYMPYTTREQFEQCYGKETVENLRTLKKRHDPEHRFGNGHTAKYFDPNRGEK